MKGRHTVKRLAGRRRRVPSNGSARTAKPLVAKVGRGRRAGTRPYAAGVTGVRPGGALRDTGGVRSEETVFVGGPLDGRVLPVLTGPTGQPPKWYEVPVPDADGGPPTVFAYRRVPAGYTKRLGLQRGWKYEYVPEGRERRTLKWPWSKPGHG